MLPVLYDLGIGPAAWLATNYSATDPYLMAFYTPLIVLAESSQFVDEILSWYVDLWG